MIGWSERLVDGGGHDDGRIVRSEDASPQLLERVARGERITITKHGRPVAVLVPPPTERADVEETVRKLIEFGRGRSLGGLTVREMVEEGRRF